MKIPPSPIPTVVALLMAGVLAIIGTLAGIRVFLHHASRTVEAVVSPKPVSPATIRAEPLFIVAAKYSCGSQSADVTQRVRELISKDAAVWANPGCLHADPHPYLNKALVIVYTVEGTPAMLSVGENEKVNRTRLLKNAQDGSHPAVAQARGDSGR